MYNIVPVAVATINLILIVFIAVKKNKSFSDFFLIVLNTLTTSLVIVNSYSSDQITTVIFFLQSFVPFLIFPVLFLIVYSYVYDGEFKGTWLLIFTIAASFLLFLIVDHSILNKYDSQSLRELYNNPPLSYHLFYKSNQVFSIIMCFLLLKDISKYEKDIKNEFSYIERIEAKWLRHCVYAYLIVSASVLILFLSSNLRIIPINIDSAYQVMGFIALLAIIYMNIRGIQSYSAYTYNEMLTQHHTDVKQLKSIKKEKKASVSHKESKSHVENEDQLRVIYNKIVDQLENQRLYLTPQLKLNDICDRVNETFHQCSKAINTIGHTTFYELVNSYRIDHFKEQLRLPENNHLTILAIGFDSGFNSKASLNRIFKNKEGISPYAFKKQLETTH